MARRLANYERQGGLTGGLARERIFLPGAAGEPTALIAETLGAVGVEIFTSFVPGVNRLDPNAIGENSVVTSIFMQPSMAEAQRAGRFRHLPMSYAATLKWLREGQPFDRCVIQVSPPDEGGRCCLGPAAEFTPEVLRRARSVVAVINPSVPRIPGGRWIAASALDRVVESDARIPEYGAGDHDPVVAAIAANVAVFVKDGSALQTGLGKVPAALMAALVDRRGLRLHSGMISDGAALLERAGALDPAWTHATTMILGSSGLYAWAEGRTDVAVKGVEYIHDPARLAAMDRLIAVNSAIEIDLFGQCNLETASGRAVSGAGGAPDFARGARLSPGGISIVALPATFGLEGSRICARLASPGMVSLSRADVDVVVTEQGAADLRGRSVHERAEAIIAIAAPDQRARLEVDWRKIVARF